MKPDVQGAELYVGDILRSISFLQFSPTTMNQIVVDETHLEKLLRVKRRVFLCFGCKIWKMMFL